MILGFLIGFAVGGLVGSPIMIPVAFFGVVFPVCLLIKTINQKVTGAL